MAGKLSAAMIAAMQATAAGAGDDTLVNRQTKPVKATWTRAQLERVQQYLSQEHWERPVYEVNFPNPTQVLAAPYSLEVGTQVVWQLTGIKTTVQGIGPETEGDRFFGVVAFCVVTGE